MNSMTDYIASSHDISKSRLFVAAGAPSILRVFAGKDSGISIDHIDEYVVEGDDIILRHVITSYAWALGPVMSLSTIGVSIKSLSLISVKFAVNIFPAPAT